MADTAPRDVSYDDYLTTSLTDPAEAAAYLDAAIQMEDTPALLLALQQLAKAHGMAEVASHTLNATGNPSLDTVTKVLHAVGLRLSVEPLRTRA